MNKRKPDSRSPRRARLDFVANVCTIETFWLAYEESMQEVDKDAPPTPDVKPYIDPDRENQNRVPVRAFTVEDAVTYAFDGEQERLIVQLCDDIALVRAASKAGNIEQATFHFKQFQYRWGDFLKTLALRTQQEGRRE